MNVRRKFIVGAGTLAASSLAIFAAHAKAQTANPACVVFDKSRQAAVTPDQALQMLKDGNDRFVGGTTINCDLRTQVKATAEGQAPFAAVVGCIDSRVPPELVFDQRLGDIFAARIAGNFVNTDVDGTKDSKNKKLVQAVADQNAKDAAAMLSARSDVLRGLVGEGKLKIVAAMHDIGTGRINWFA